MTLGDAEIGDTVILYSGHRRGSLSRAEVTSVSPAMIRVAHLRGDGVVTHMKFWKRTGCKVGDTDPKGIRAALEKGIRYV